MTCRSMLDLKSAGTNSFKSSLGMPVVVAVDNLHSQAVEVAGNADGETDLEQVCFRFASVLGLLIFGML